MAGSRVALPPGPMPSSGELLVVRVPPLVWVVLLVQVLPLGRVLPLCAVSRPPLLLLSSFPGLRREGLYKALRRLDLSLERFLPGLHPDQEQRPNWCPSELTLRLAKSIHFMGLLLKNVQDVVS
ncbi:hypothetical protein NDU88_003196 [Pleurodeles waltl]|uniref:Uncharacterized protein n=1 Tax=Pleurodeles waltl TaxID=8319 RepID=A0AAV7LEQ1_PLEWA|nr:hypothetical protein NDU88_003196 [Pleurodeles waltl]